jgi:hypothetical protein
MKPVPVEKLTGRLFGDHPSPMYASFLAEILLKSKHSNQCCLLGSPSLGFFQQAGTFLKLTWG